MEFLKIEGCGNHFVVLSSERPIGSDAARSILDPAHGVGGDGLLVLRGEEPDGFRVDMLNPDGSPMGMCGNGVRCVARYLDISGRIGASRRVVLLVGDRAVSCRLAGGDLVEADLGEPILEPGKIPVRASSLSGSIEVDGISYEAAFASLGNPHCVIFLPRISEEEARRAGPLIERHPLFPERANVSFCRVDARDRLSALVWERGAGLTAACGTGASACVVSGARLGLCDRRAEVALPGGTLSVEWSDETNRVRIEGPAREIYWGKLCESFSRRCFGER